MLTIDDFDKVRQTPEGSHNPIVIMTPKEPIAGLDNLEITMSQSSWSQNGSRIWEWKWWANNNQSFDSSEGKHGGPPLEHHFNLHNAARAAIKSASYWSDDERIPRQEKERAESAKKKELQDRQIDRFLNS